MKLLQKMALLSVSWLFLGSFQKTIHVIEHDIVLTQDIIFDYMEISENQPCSKFELLNSLNLGKHDRLWFSKSLALKKSINLILLPFMKLST